MLSKEQLKIKKLKADKAKLKDRIAKQIAYISDMEKKMKCLHQTINRANAKISEVRHLLEYECCICLETIKTEPKFAYQCKDHPLHIDCFIKYAYCQDKTPIQTSCPMCRAEYDPNSRLFVLSMECKETLPEDGEFAPIDPPTPIAIPVDPPTPVASPILPYSPPVITISDNEEEEEEEVDIPCAQDPYQLTEDFKW